MIIDLRRLTAAVILLLVIGMMADLPSATRFGYFADPGSLLMYGIIPLVVALGYAVSTFIKKFPDVLRTALLCFLVIFVFGNLLNHQTDSRRSHGSAANIIDGAVQTEEAARFFRQGINPYRAAYAMYPFTRYYTDTAGAEHLHPARTHYVYLPATFLITAPLQAASEALFGWFDVRWLYGAGFVFLLLGIGVMVPAPGRDLAIALVALSPFTMRLLLFGINDYALLALIVFSILFLHKQRLTYASILMGLALSWKQSA